LKLPLALALLGSLLPAFGQFGGPAILSRGQTPAPMAASQISFRPFVSLLGTVDTGLAGVSVTTSGELAGQTAEGVTLSWGVSGSHLWPHSRLGVFYEGSLNHYTRQTYFDTINQTFMLGFTHQFSPRMTLSLRESLGTYSRFLTGGTLTQSSPFDPVNSYVPVTDFFDNRTTYLTTQADFTLQRSARLSFNMGGDGFIIRRRSAALNGTVGASARGDVQYRASRQSTVGGGYSYVHYDFTRVLGGTDGHIFTGSYARLLSRTVEFSGYAGVMRIESKFARTVPLDPVIALLLGISGATQVVHTVSIHPVSQGRISKTFRTGVAYAGAGQEVNPGNGLFLTSYSTTARAGYNYSGLRRWSLGISAAYIRSSATGNITGVYTTTGGTLSASRRLFRGTHMVLNTSVRQYNSPDFHQYKRVVYQAGIGLSFSPGEIPLRIW
jgi:hypothetical protein